MSRLMPYLIMGVILFMLVISWKNVLGYYSSITESYQSHIEKAEAYMAKRIYIDAVSEYELALQVKPEDYDVAMKIVGLYDNLGNENGWIKACQNAISADKLQKEPYLLLADYYMETGSLQEAYDVLIQAQQNLEDQTEIDSRIYEIKGQYSVENMSYDEITPFVYSDDTQTGYAVISYQDKKGIMNTNLETSYQPVYEEIGIPGQGVIPIYEENEWFYINEEGYRKLVPDHEAEYLGTFHDNYAPAKINDVYGYLDKDMKEYHFEYEEAGCFANGLAPVKQNGKWAVINTDFELVTPFQFDEILMDEYGFCSTYQVFFAKQNDQYYLYDSEGKQISEGFDDAKLFASEEPAAVKRNGKWGFVSHTGEILTEFCYQDANSFCLGYAPYCENGKWGCIDEQGIVLIKPKFDDLQAFTQGGYALAEENGIPEFIGVTTYS